MCLVVIRQKYADVTNLQVDCKIDCFGTPYESDVLYLILNVERKILYEMDMFAVMYRSSSQVYNSRAQFCSQVNGICLFIILSMLLVEYGA